MTDPLKNRLDALKKISSSAQRRASLYSEITSINDEHTARSLSVLQKAPAPGKKLQKIGFLMLWIPEPTGVTCAIGGPMIVAGRYLDKKYNGSTLHDIGAQTKHTASSIRDFKNTVM